MANEIRSRAEINEMLKNLNLSNEKIISPMKGVLNDQSIKVLKWVLNGSN